MPVRDDVAASAKPVSTIAAATALRMVVLDLFMAVLL
jgi:hypothetical protein